MFEAHAGVGGAEQPVDALWGGVASLRPRGALRRNRGLPRQAAHRSGPGESTAVPGRKPPLYALGLAARLGGRKCPVKGGVGMGVQRVADPDQALGLAVARRIRHGLHRGRPGAVGLFVPAAHRIARRVELAIEVPLEPRSPPPAPAADRVVPDARASVRFLARSAPSRGG